MKGRERGTTTVEFAIVGALALVVLFGVIEVGRMLFVWNTIAEATRRGARVAAVCPINSPAVDQVTIFGTPGGSSTTSPVLSGLSTANVKVEYMEADGDLTLDYIKIDFVRVSIINYQHTLLIPFFVRTISVPTFSTTLPNESLGYIPDINMRKCFGMY